MSNRWPIAKGRTVKRIPGQMNKTEQRYAQHLEILKMAGRVLEFWFEGVKLRMADNTFYTPDFMVMLPGGEIELVDIKGSKVVDGKKTYYATEDAKLKIKLAAELFPFRFVIAWEAFGIWQTEEFTC